jgi:hypothetical protein
MTIEEAREIAARCWCAPETSGIEMDTRLTEAFARALLARKPAVPQYSKNIKWPQGYCLDPNGVMCTPPGMHEAWSFGYDLGYADALAIRSPTAPAQSCGDAEQADAVQVDTPGKLILNGELVNVGIDESGIGDMELIVGTRGVLLSGLSIDETKALAPLLFQAVKLIVARASSTGDQA